MTDAVPNYAELPLGRFVDMVASREPAPGGGASAAVAIALAAALTAMAARFSADNLADAETIAERAEELRNKVMPLAQADAAAYGRVLDAYRTPRDDDEKRRRRIREALSEAADVPLSIAESGWRWSVMRRGWSKREPEPARRRHDRRRPGQGWRTSSSHACRDQRLRRRCRR